MPGFRLFGSDGRPSEPWKGAGGDFRWSKGRRSLGGLSGGGRALALAIFLGMEALWGAGLVTDIHVVGERIYAVRPGGLTVGVGARMEWVHRPEFRWIAFEPIQIGDQNHFLAVGGQPGASGVLSDYRLMDGVEEVEVLAEDLLYDIALHSESRRVAVACADGRVLTARYDGNRPRAWKTRSRHTAPVRSVAFSRDGRWIASGGLDGLVLVADAGTNDEPLALQDHSDQVECVIFSPDSNSIISGARDGRVRVHSVGGRLIRSYSSLGGHRGGRPGERQNRILSLANTPDGMVAGSSLGNVYRLSETSTASDLAVTLDAPVNAIAVGPRVFLGGSRVHELK